MSQIDDAALIYMDPKLIRDATFMKVPHRVTTTKDDIYMIPGDVIAQNVTGDRRFKGLDPYNNYVVKIYKSNMHASAMEEYIRGSKLSNHGLAPNYYGVGIIVDDNTYNILDGKARFLLVIDYEGIPLGEVLTKVSDGERESYIERAKMLLEDCRTRGVILKNDESWMSKNIVVNSDDELFVVDLDENFDKPN